MADSPPAVLKVITLAAQLEKAGYSTVINVPAYLKEWGFALLAEAFRPRSDVALDMPWKSLLGSVLISHVTAVGCFMEAPIVREVKSTLYAIAAITQSRVIPLFSGLSSPVGADLFPDLVWPLLDVVDLFCLHGPREEQQFNALISGTRFSTHARAQIAVPPFCFPIPPVPNSTNKSPASFLLLLRRDLKPTAWHESVIEQLSELASISPDWHVSIAHPTPYRRTQDVDSHPINQLLSKLRDCPPNLQFSSQPLGELLEQNLFCAGFSTPIWFYSLVRGCRSFCLADFGVRSSEGNDLFFGSGLMRRLASMEVLSDLESLPLPSPGWWQWLFADASIGIDSLAWWLDRQASRA